MLNHHPVKRFSGSRRERDYQVRTVCQECAVGCGLLAHVKDGRIVDIEGEEEHPISRGRLCARGTAFVQGLTLPERLTHPASRKERREPLQALDDWKSGLDLLAERLRQVKEQHGPDSLLIGCDLEGGLDFYLGAMRFAQLWGTSQVFHPLGDPSDPWPAGLNSPAASCSDWVHSRCLFLVEADLAASHPVAFSWVLEAQRRGAHVVAADARFTATLAKADETLRIKPEQGNLLGLTIMKLIMEEGGQDVAAMEAGFTESRWPESFEQMSLEGAEAALGISLEKLRHLARLLVQRGPVTVITGKGLDDLPHHHIWLTLATAMGWVGRPGGGWYPVEAGAPPLKIHTYTGEANKRPEGGHHEIPPKLAEVKSRADQPVRAIISSGNCLYDYLSPFGRLTKQVDLITHFGGFPNATWARATMSFPAALWAERDGLAFSNDRAIQWGAKIVEPPAGCRSGLDFWMELARRFGWEVHFPWATEEGRADHVAFYSWLMAQSPLTAKLKVDQLQNLEPGSQIFWPVGKIVLPNARAPYKGKIVPQKAPAALSAQVESEAAAYPFAFQEARISCRSGDASRFWPWTRGLSREDAVQINPETADVLGIENGDEVLIETPRGVLAGRACLSRMVPRWLVSSPHGVNGVPALVHKKEQSQEEARNLLKELSL